MQNKNPRENKKKKEGFAKLTGHKQVTNIYSNRELELSLASAASDTEGEEWKTPKDW